MKSYCNVELAKCRKIPKKTGIGRPLYNQGQKQFRRNG